MMKLAVMILTLWCAGAWAVESDSDRAPLTDRDAIQGPNLEAILTALPELERLHLDYRKYRIAVGVSGDQLMVLFSDLNKALGRPGWPTMAGIAILLSPDGKTVTGIEWQR